MKRLMGVFAFCCGLLGCPADSFREGDTRVGHVVINEALYNLPEGRDLEEWVELYNNSDETVNLKGWVIDDRDTHRFEFLSNLFFAPGEYLLFFTNAEAMQRSPVKKNDSARVMSYQTAGGKPLNLQIWNNDGDDILLIDNQGTIVDYVEFGELQGKGKDPCPENAVWQGTIFTPPPGFSIALFPNGYDMDSSENWSFRSPEQLTPGAEN